MWIFQVGGQLALGLFSGALPPHRGVAENFNRVFVDVGRNRSLFVGREGHRAIALNVELRPSIAVVDTALHNRLQHSMHKIRDPLVIFLLIET